MKNVLIDTLDRLVSSDDIDSRWDASTELAAHWGIKSLLVSQVDTDRSDIKWINTNMSDSWMDEYMGEQYALVDPLIQDEAFITGTRQLDAGTMALDGHHPKADIALNHGLKSAGYDTLLCTKFGDSQSLGTYVTLGFETQSDLKNLGAEADPLILSALLAASISAPLSPTQPPSASPLKDRQREVLALLAEGHQTARIA